MKERILKVGRRLFIPPVFAQNDKTQAVSQIYAILWVQILSITVIEIVLSILAPTYIKYWLALTFSSIVISLALLELARRGRTYLTSLLLVAELWAIITISAWMAGGIGARAAWGYFIVVFIAGMLLGRPAGIIMAGIGSLSTLAIAFLSPVVSPHPLQFWLTNTMYLIFVNFLQFLASRSIRDLLAKTGSELRERLLAQAALFESERKHREMVNFLPFCVFEADLSGKLTFANQTTLDWFGFNEADFLAGMNILDTITDIDKQSANEAITRIGSGEHISFHEYLVKRKDGSHFTALVQTRRIFENSVPVGLQGSLIDISDRKQVEREREHNISLLKATLESTNDGILVVDLTGKIAHFNQRFVQMWQIPDKILASGEDAQALTFVCNQLIDPQGFVDRVQKLYTDSMAESFDLLEFKDGSYFERYSRPQLLDGRPVGRVWSFRDISERKRAEKEISAWKQRFENVTAASNQIVYDYDFATGDIQWSGSIEKVLGYQLAEMNGGLTRWEDLIAPQDRDEAMRLLDISVKNGTPYQVEYGFRHKNGHYVKIFDRGLVMHDAADQPERMIGMMQDITERQWAELAMKESEQRYRTLFESASDSIFVMKEDLFFDCNSRTLEIFGCTREQILGTSLDHFSPPLQPDARNSREKAQEKINAAYSGTPQFFEWLHSKADGTPFMTEVSMNRIELGSGWYLLAVIRDISERKMLEEQLRQAQKMEAVGILAGGIAHDFNNILSTIVGYASLLQMQAGLDKKMKEYLERILASTERAASLTQSLLAFSRKQVIELQSVDINNSIFGFHKVLARLIGEDIDFKLNLASESLVVAVDIRQIEQVLMNLATNARDAMPHGGKLTITTRSVVLEDGNGEIPNGSYAVISVSDTGTGMDSEVQSHVFEPFYTTKEVGKGTGLGLAIAYGIVKNHQGFIRIDSESTHGTIFHIYLPLKPLAVQKDRYKKQEKIPGGNETILLVEDDAAVRHVTRSMLEEFGYTVLEASDGIEALAVFVQHRDQVRLLLSDLIMPKKNGKETRAEIMKLKPDIKTIFMSGYTSDIIARKGILEPGKHLLLKPLHPATLFAKIREVLDS